MLNYQRVSVFVCERSLVRWLLDGLYGARGSTIKNYETLTEHGDGSKPWYLVNPKIAGKWMFIPLKMVLIGIDPYPHEAWHGGSMRTWSINHALSSQAVPPKVIHILGSELQATGVNWPISAMNPETWLSGDFPQTYADFYPEKLGWTWLDMVFRWSNPGLSQSRSWLRHRQVDVVRCRESSEWFFWFGSVQLVSPEG